MGYFRKRPDFRITEYADGRFVVETLSADLDCTFYRCIGTFESEQAAREEVRRLKAARTVVKRLYFGDGDTS